MSAATAINAKLTEIFRNGKAEVGLEVGTDPGLSPDEYIQVPTSMRKRWAYRLVNAAECQAASPGGTKSEVKPRYDRKLTDTVASLDGKAAWRIATIGDQMIEVVDGTYSIDGGDLEEVEDNGEEIDDILVEPFTYDDMRRFVVANTGHIRDTTTPEQDHWWIHATRFWSLVSGLVVGSKQKEWVIVEDPRDNLDAASDIVARMVDGRENAITAAAARAANWRKTNHATGGEMAAGFPKRWLAKNNRWNNTGEAARRISDNTAATSSFYVATHAVAVHNALALMAPSDDCHWAVIDPSFGMILEWDVKESAQIRIAPKDQVAGTAIVVDSIVVLKMLTMEGIVPFLENYGEIPAFLNAYSQVKLNGVRAATYASWFLNGHPAGIDKVSFSQKDSSFASLVGELGAVAGSYYKKSTIGDSPALKNASLQMATETSKTRWLTMARAKSSASNEVAVKAYTRITGASGGAFLSALGSDVKSEVEEGVRDYNDMTSRVEGLLGLAGASVVKVSEVMKSMDRVAASAGTAEVAAEAASLGLTES